MLSISPEKLFSFSRCLRFCIDFLVMYWKGLIEKINFKFYDVTTWLRSNFNAHIAQYFERPDFAFHVCLQQFSISCIRNNDLLEFNRSVAESCCSTGFRCAFEQINVFWTSGFDFISIVFDSLSVSRSLPELYFSHSI